MVHPATSRERLAQAAWKSLRFGISDFEIRRANKINSLLHCTRAGHLLACPWAIAPCDIPPISPTFSRGPVSSTTGSFPQATPRTNQKRGPWFTLLSKYTHLWAAWGEHLFGFFQFTYGENTTTQAPSLANANADGLGLQTANGKPSTLVRLVLVSKLLYGSPCKRKAHRSRPCVTRAAAGPPRGLGNICFFCC